MKKILAITISLVMILSTVVAVNAYDPLEPSMQAEYWFKDYYKAQTGGKEAAGVSAEWISGFEKDIYLISFTSTEADTVNEKYCATYGKYYETSDVINLLFPTGYVIYETPNVYNDYVAEDFHPLAYYSTNNTKLLDTIAQLCKEGKLNVGFGIVEEEPTPTQPASETQPTATEPATQAPTVEKQAEKKENTMMVSVKTRTVKAKKLKNAKQTVKAITVSKAKGKVSYAKVKTGTTKKIFKKVTIGKNGKLTLKKGTYKKGTYKIKVKITAKGNSAYKSKSKTVTVRIKVK